MVIHCEERYEEMLKYAQEIGDTSLKECLDRLKEWEKNAVKANRPMEIHIYSDWEKHSFEFSEIYADGHRGIVGGILFHGTPESADNSMAVCIDGRAYGWRIHT